MKGIVVETKGKYAIILTQGRSFVKVKAMADMPIGEEIDLNRPAGRTKNTRVITKITSIAAAGLLALGLGYASYCYTVPYSYVHVDINPSIELTANIYDRIIGVEALNTSGEELLGGSNLKNHKVDMAVKQLLNTAVQHGYLNAYELLPADSGSAVEGQQAGDGQGMAYSGQALDNPQEPPTTISKTETKSEGAIENAVLLTVTSNNSKKSNALKDNIVKAATKELRKEKVRSEVLIGEASVEQRDAARVYGVTPGKLVLIEDVLESEPESQIEELKKVPIKDLLSKASHKAKEKAKQEKQKAREKAKQEEQKAREMAKQEEQKAREMAKQEEQKAGEKAKQEEQKASEKAGKEEQRAKEKAEQEEIRKQNDRKEKQSENKNNSVRQSSTGKGFGNDSTQKRRAGEDDQKGGFNDNTGNNSRKNENSKWNAGSNSKNQDNSGNSKAKDNKKDKNKSKKTKEDLKREGERLREELLDQMKDWQKQGSWTNSNSRKTSNNRR